MTMRQVKVEVLRYADDGEDEVVKTLGPMPESKATKVENGMNLNLNHDKYWTRQVEVYAIDVSGTRG